MPEIKASPSNPLLKDLATALANVRGFLNPAPGTPLDSVEWFRPGNLLLGKSPEEIENWAYGNAPFQFTQLGDRLPKPKTGRAESLADTAFAATDFLPVGALAKGIAQAPSVIRGGKAAQKGAVRVGGDPGTVAIHATGYGGVQNAGAIKREGLYAPSIGLNYKTANDYNSGQPQYVFRAGALDRPFVDEAPPGIFNRDAFVWNPSRGGGSMIDQWKYSGINGLSKEFSDLAGDARLSQMLPDRGSHMASILASPRFRSLKEWEESDLGAGALLGHPRASGQKMHEYTALFDELVQQYGLGESKRLELFRQFPGLIRGQIDPQYIQGTALGDLYSAARRAPSQMGEMKIYAPSVPAGPNEASIYIPSGATGSDADVYRDLGYQVYGPEEIAGLAGQREIPYTAADTRLDLLAPASGQAPIEPEDARRMFYENRSRGYTPGWEPPAKPFTANDPFGQLPPSDPSLGKPPEPDFSVDDFIDEMSGIYGKEALYNINGNWSVLKPDFTSALSPEHQAQWKAIKEGLNKTPTPPAVESKAPAWWTPGNTYQDVMKLWDNYDGGSVEAFLQAQFGKKEGSAMYDEWLSPGAPVFPDIIKKYMDKQVKDNDIPF